MKSLFNYGNYRQNCHRNFYQKSCLATLFSTIGLGSFLLFNSTFISAAQAQQFKFNNYRNDRQPVIITPSRDFEKPIEKPTIPSRRESVRESEGISPLATGDSTTRNSTKGCQLEQRVFAIAETKSFFIFLCGADDAKIPDTYVSIAKHRDAKIDAPLTRVGANVFKATRGNSTHTITPKHLTVYLGKRIVLKESMLRYRVKPKSDRSGEGES